MSDAQITLSSVSGVVQRNTDYKLDFSIKAPEETVSEEVPLTVEGSIDSGYMFSVTLDKAYWKSISSIGVS